MKYSIIIVLSLLCCVSAHATNSVDIVIADDIKQAYEARWAFAFTEGMDMTNSVGTNNPFGLWLRLETPSSNVHWRTHFNIGQLNKGTNEYGAKLYLAMTNSTPSRKLYIGKDASEYIRRMGLVHKPREGDGS